MAIDPNIVLSGNQPSNLLTLLGGGLGAGQDLRALLAKRQIGNMQQLDSENERKAFADNSMFSRELNAQLSSDASEKAAQELAAQKARADIAKTESETLKNNQQGQGYELDNAGKIQTAIQNAVSYGAQTGDKNAVLTGLGVAANSGLITPEQYKIEAARVSAMQSPDEVKQYAQSAAIANSQNPGQYYAQTANNVADNTLKQQISDNEMGLKEKELKQKGEQFNQTMSFNEAKEAFNRKEGIVKQFGDKVFFIDKFGNPPKLLTDIPSIRSETPIQKNERIEKTQNYATASRGAADGAELAKSIQTRYKNLGYSPLRFAAAAKIPGTEAYNLNRDIETLQSNIFLAKTGEMRGLGALTDQEGARLAASMGSLDPLQGGQFIENLGNIAQQFANIAKNNSNKAKLYAGQQPQGEGKVYSQSDIATYAQQSGKSLSEVRDAILKSGGKIE